ncbi:MAG: DUF934 domain-containing protein [Gammaproteobacteria bacterium]|nr:DUF934 domain-containing protein [Gammaproteobacteria bacterium]
MADLILKGELLVTDDWRFLDADEPIPNLEQSLVFPFTRWLDEHEQCINHPGHKGVALENTDCVTRLLSDLDELQLICIDFPSAVDGRGYSQARILRERYGYKNELRAVGEVLVDQLFLLKRCGFNAFALQADQMVCQAPKYLNPFSSYYQ